jgi:hypothetical protein
LKGEGITNGQVGKDDGSLESRHSTEGVRYLGAPLESSYSGHVLGEVILDL